MSFPITYIREPSGNANWFGSRTSAYKPSSSPFPANYHQLQPGEFDLTGRTSPRRDLVGFVRLLRKLGLRAWVRPLPPVPGLVNVRLDAAQQRAWLKQLEQVLATQTASHGGPDRLRGGPRPGHRCRRASRVRVTTISANEANAFARSREAMSTARGALLWTDVEDALYPAGWAANPSTLLRKGAVGLSGDEHPATGALRRDAALLRGWARLFADLHHVALPKPASGKLPEGVNAVELVSPSASAVSVTNTSLKPFRDDLRVAEPHQQKDAADSGRERGSGTILVASAERFPGPRWPVPRVHQFRPHGTHRVRHRRVAVD